MDQAAQHQNNPPQLKWASRALLPCSSSLILLTQGTEGSESNGLEPCEKRQTGIGTGYFIFAVREFKNAISPTSIEMPLSTCTHYGPRSLPVGPLHSTRPPSAAAQKHTPKTTPKPTAGRGLCAAHSVPEMKIVAFVQGRATAALASARHGNSLPSCSKECILCIKEVCREARSKEDRPPTAGWSQ